MKTKILGCIAAVLVAAVAAFNVNFSMNADNALSAINLSNVEALAQESSTGAPVVHFK